VTQLILSTLQEKTEAIMIIETTEEKEKGNTCLVSQPPHHDLRIHIKHLPEDKWHGTTYFEGEIKEINFQPLISITKLPLKKTTLYAINYQGFVWMDSTLVNPILYR
jgi:hypothetical protein